MVLFNIILIILHLNNINAANILAIAPTPAYSHQVLFRPIWKALLNRGHHLTLLTTDPMNDTSFENLTEINLHFAYGLVNKTKIVNKYRNNFLDIAEDLLEARSYIYDEEMKISAIQELIKSTNTTFDLFIAEYAFPAFSMFKHKFKCPFIGIVSMDAHAVAHDIMGDYEHPIAYPDSLTSFDNAQISFKQRILSVLFYIYIRYYIYYRVFPEQEKVAKKHFGYDTPSLLSVAEDVDMLFVNFNPILFYARPSVPAVLYIGGGMHINTENNSLPQDLKTYLDNSEFGVIYFSLGTNVKSTDIAPENIKVILDTFKELPYDVLWKYEEKLEEKPKNVKTFKWLPQQAILRHPKIVLFITQGGLQSIEEGIYYNIPMLGIPFLVDQIFNVMKVVSKGIGLYVNHQNLNKIEFKTNILELINNPKYKINIDMIRKLTLDQPMNNVEKVVWWTEYVIRNKGAKYLRGTTYNIPFYQYYLLDVISFFILIIVIISYIVIKIGKLLLGKSSNKVKVQ